MTGDNSPLDGEKKAEEAPNSVIKEVFDQFAITHIFKTIIDKTSWKATDQLNDAIVLFIFLFGLFFGLQLIKPEPSLAMVTLLVLFFFIIVEFVGANIPYFSRLFFSEEKSDYFIKNIDTYSTIYVERNLSLLTFSPKNINSLLSMIGEHKRRIHPFIIDDILLLNPLSTENLDRVFSREILELNLRRELINDLLMKYKDRLSSENINNFFSVYCEDEQLIKTLIATQVDSESLVYAQERNENLKSFFEKYHKNIKNKARISSLISRTQINIIFYRGIALIIATPICWIIILLCAHYFQAVNPSSVNSIMLSSFFISGLLAGYIVIPIVNRVVYWWIDHWKGEFFEFL